MWSLQSFFKDNGTVNNKPSLNKKHVTFVLVFLYSIMVFFFLLDYMKGLSERNPVFIKKHVPLGSCRLQPVSPEEAAEERRILDSIAWPETLPLPEPFNLWQTSDPAHSTFTIVSEKKERRVGEQLTVIIQVKDFRGRPKESGGDLLMTRLHNPELGAGVVGQVLDHLNGSYSAVFPLLWVGRAHVEVKLVHSSEAITVLHRIGTEQPDRVYFQSVFQSGLLSETTNCSFCLPQTQPLCNFTDLITGEPWFCYKPKQLSCDTRLSHNKGGYIQNITENESKLFQQNINVKVSIQALNLSSVIVLPKMEQRSKVMNSALRPAGFYYKGEWQALDGTSVHHNWNSSQTRSCLRNKVIYMFGDSTVRQWFTQLESQLGLHAYVLGDIYRGPYLLVDHTLNMFLSYRHHGVPVHIPPPIFITHLRLIANEIDRVPGGHRTVVVFGIWAHLTIYPVEFYLRRLLIIRRAVKRMLNRAPKTMVIIRTANPKESSLYYIITNSDWYSLQRDRVLRAVFRGMNVHLVDAWEMVQAHALPHYIHPPPKIIKNMLDTVLSYIC